MLKSFDVTKKYGSTTAVDGVTLELPPGHIYAMLGPNGSGKTTWMKMAAGLVKPTSGTITYDDMNIGPATKRQIAYMSTEPYFYSWMSVRDAGKYYGDFFRDFSDEKYRMLLERMELTGDMKVKALSTGMMAKLKIAVTMAREARVIMLDEPLNGIDLIARDEIAYTIRELAGRDVTLLVSSHLVEELEEISDSAVFMKRGRLVLAGSTDDIKRQEGKSITDVYRDIYGGGEALREGGLIHRGDRRDKSC